MTNSKTDNTNVKKVLVRVNGNDAARVWMPENFEELSAIEIMRATGFFEGKLPVETMIELTPEHIARFTPNEFYQIPTNDPSTHLDWVVIPKNGSTYVEGRLKIEGHGPYWRARRGGITKRPRLAHIDMHPVIDEGCRWETNKKLIIVRDPIDRAISAYQHLLRQPFRAQPGTSTAHITVKMKFWQKLFEPVTDTGGVKVDLDSPKSPKDIVYSFMLFLQESEKYGFYNKHAFPQTKFLTDLGLSIEDVDYIIPFEDLKEGIDKLCEMYGLSGASHTVAIKENRNSSVPPIKKLLQKFLAEDEPAAARVKKLYEEDFELYNRVKHGNHFYR
tara:strand:- start:2692 stop:3684 length:993 start_codon:yes stop_codon:yes gene_type:complete